MGRLEIGAPFVYYGNSCGMFVNQLFTGCKSINTTTLSTALYTACTQKALRVFCDAILRTDKKHQMNL